MRTYLLIRQHRRRRKSQSLWAGYCYMYNNIL